ncbi:hypothetical protein B0O80DRAFT_102733 [Mortierella sp. GBAus27b]|nr:hypothetical protein B0O80DRAFT_102733 [Mortierella sp. GBAus27b]
MAMAIRIVHSTCTLVSSEPSILPQWKRFSCCTLCLVSYIGSQCSFIHSYLCARRL